MHADADVFRRHGIEEGVAADPGVGFVNQDGIEVIGVTGVLLGRCGEGQRQAGECGLVLLPDLPAPQPVLFDPFQLVQADGRLDVVHVVACK